MKMQGFKLETTQSGITWAGRDATGIQNGTIDFKESILNFKNGELAGGKFTVDTTPIKILAITDPSPNMPGERSASDNLFSSVICPIADFEILTVTKRSENFYLVIGNLTINGITLLVSLEAAIILNGETISVSGTMVFHQADFDMSFHSAGFKVMRSN